MSQVKTIHNSGWRDGFLFVGNRLVLDFLNTRPVQNGEPTELLPDFGALLRWFQAAELLSARDAANLRQKWGKSARAQRMVEGVRELREKLRKQVLAWEGGGAVRHSTVVELNRLMAEHPMRTRLKTSGSASAAELWFQARQPEDLFAPLAHSMATLLASVERSRVRKCEQCVLHFYDTSKKGTRRWCSMQLCGNRLKVAAYAARQRMRAHRAKAPSRSKNESPSTLQGPITK
jgi:predicted RNA-binding Zn ribbon-like protein